MAGHEKGREKKKKIGSALGSRAKTGAEKTKLVNSKKQKPKLAWTPGRNGTRIEKLLSFAFGLAEVKKN